MNENYVKQIVISGIVLILLDGSYILTNIEKYKTAIREIQGRELAVKDYTSIAICYVFLVFGLYYFILREKKSVIDAAFFGLVVYGVYAATIYTMFKGYPGYLAILDTLWGGILMAATTWITYFVNTN
jgi:uncharacterized membrane protein